MGVHLCNMYHQVSNVSASLRSSDSRIVWSRVIEQHATSCGRCRAGAFISLCDSCEGDDHLAYLDTIAFSFAISRAPTASTVPVTTESLLVQQTRTQQRR